MGGNKRESRRERGIQIVAIVRVYAQWREGGLSNTPICITHSRIYLLQSIEFFLLFLVLSLFGSYHDKRKFMVYSCIGLSFDALFTF